MALRVQQYIDAKVAEVMASEVVQQSLQVRGVSGGGGLCGAWVWRVARRQRSRLALVPQLQALWPGSSCEPGPVAAHARCQRCCRS